VYFFYFPIFVRSWSMTVNGAIFGNVVFTWIIQ
jgi:hypothetical protein